MLFLWKEDSKILSVGQVNDVLQNVGLAGKVDPNKYTSRGDLEGSPGQSKLAQELGGSYGQTSSQPSSQSFGGGGNVQDLQSIIDRTLQMQQQATQPAIQAIQQGIPETQQIYAGQTARAEAQRQPLLDRYNNLLAQIKGNQQTAENRQTLTTQNELGRRGISGGLAERTLTESLNPITSQYAGLTKEAGIGQEQGLQSLNELIGGIGEKETMALQNARNTIAQLQSGAGQNAISTAMDLLAKQQQASQFGITSDIQRQQVGANAQQNAIENAIKQMQLQNQTLQTQYDIKKPYYNPKEGTEPSLTFQTTEDTYGNKQIVGLDPKTGQVKSTYSAPTTPAPAKKPGLLDQLGQQFGNVLKYFNIGQ